MYEGQRDTLYSQQFNMEQTRFAVESVQDTVQTVQALKGAAKTMRGAMKANRELDLNFIDKLQDELADMTVRERSIGGGGDGGLDEMGGDGQLWLRCVGSYGSLCSAPNALRITLTTAVTTTSHHITSPPPPPLATARTSPPRSTR